MNFRIVFLFCLISGSVLGALPDTLDKSVKVSGLPILGYTPETSFGFGAVTPIVFKSKDSTEFNRPSTIQPVGIVTVKKLN